MGLDLVCIHTFKLKRILLTLPEAFGTKQEGHGKIIYNLCLLVAELHKVTPSPAGLMPLSHSFCAAWRLSFCPTVLGRMLQQVLLLLGETSAGRRVAIFMSKSCSNWFIFIILTAVWTSFVLHFCYEVSIVRGPTADISRSSGKGLQDHLSYSKPLSSFKATTNLPSTQEKHA